MVLYEMRQRLDEIKGRLQEIHTEFGERALDEERQTEWDGLEKEYDSLAESVKRAEEREEKMKSMIASGSAAREAGSDRGTPAFHKERDIFDVDSLVRDTRPENLGMELRDNAMRAVEKARYSPLVKRKSDAQERVEYLLDNVDNERGDLAKRLLTTGSPVYERAFGKAIRDLNTHALTGEEARAMSTASSGGGYAVPFQLDPSVILTNNGATNPLREMARIETIVGKEWQGVTSAGITVSRDAEASEVSDDSPTLAQPTVKAERVAGFVPFSIEIDMDWTQFRGEVSRMLADARDREEATSFVTGNGVSPAANGIVATLSGNTVETATGTTFAAADVYSLEEALAPRWRTANAQFLANHTVYNKIRQFATADGHALWERIGAGQPAELLGYRAREASAMSSATTTAAAKILLFGDFSNFLIVDRVGMNVELVPHLFHTDNNRPTGQRGIYAIWRNNSKVLVDAAFKLLVVKA